MLAPMTTDLLDRLGGEHAELLPCVVRLAELAQSDSADLGAALDRCAIMLGASLDEHIKHEDEVLFPAYAGRVGEEGLIAPFRDDHREILTLRDEIYRMRRSGIADGTKLSRTADRLAELLHSHMTREDQMLFPAIRHALS